MQLWFQFLIGLVSYLCLLPASVTAVVRPLQTRDTYASNPDVLVNGTNGDPGVYPISPDGASKGWRFMPDITSLAGATLDTTSIKVGTNGATLTHYITSNYTASSIKRAVVIVHGEDRPSWNMQIYTSLALERAIMGGTVKSDEVVIMAP